jgi:hypothetical protein
MAQHFTFTFTFEIKRTSGKFASRYGRPDSRPR